MGFFDTNPNRFRIFYGVLVFCMVAIAAISLYRFAGSATDENLFSTTPGDLYITKPMIAQLIDDAADTGDPDDIPAQRSSIDTIRVGDLLLSINNRTISKAARLRKYLSKLPVDEQIELIVFRPAVARELTFRLPKSSIPDSSFRKIPSTVFITQVTEGGASDRAGLRVGDLIYRINDQRFKDQFEAMKILIFAQSGNTVAYDIIRNNKALTLTITLASAGIRLTVLMMVLCGLVFWGVAFFVAFQRPEFPAARLMGLAFLAVGFFLITLYPSITNRIGTYDDLTVGRDILVTLCIFFSFPLWLHLDHYFPVEREELLSRKWILYGAYALTVVAIILLAVTKNFLFFILGIFVLTIYSRLVPWFFRKERSEESKKLGAFIHRIFLIYLAIFFLAVIGFLIFESRGGPLVSGPPLRGPFIEFFRGYFGIPLMMIPLSYLLTIGHYRLLNMDLRVRRNIQYNVVSIAWGAAMLLLLFEVLFRLPAMSLNLPNIKFQGSFIEVMEQPMTIQERVMAEKLIISFLAIAVFGLLWWIRRRVQGFIDKKFDRTEYDYRKAASELAEVMGAQFTMEGLAQGIVSKLATLMQVKQVGVLFFRNEQICCSSYVYGMPEAQWNRFSSQINEEIIQLIRSNRSDYRFSTDFLPEDIQEEFESQGFKHIIAIRSKEKLVGTLLFGEKRSESPFHKDDLVFLSAVAKQASVAIENTFLYEELAEQERLKHELEIARRIQLASLPQATPTLEGLDIAGISIPAQEVGGDYFDYLNHKDCDITVIIGDVSGKGTSAALYMSKVQGVLRSLHDFGLSPRELFVRANQLLITDMEKQSFVTAMGATFETSANHMTFARAGHLPLYHFRAHSGVVEMHTPGGIGLGLTASHKFTEALEEQQIHYEADDIFLFITDGITEAHNGQSEEFGDEQVLEILKTSNGSPAKRIRDKIVTAVKHFAGNTPQHDDLTIVVVKAV